jgi:alpha/beta superfamily hydrolase
LQVAGYVAVGFPLGFWSNLLLHGRSHWQQLVQQTNLPKLFITGDKDNFTTVEMLQGYVEALQANSGSNSSNNNASSSSSPGGINSSSSTPGAINSNSSNPRATTSNSSADVDLVVMPGADHFFVERWEELADVVCSWVGKVEGRHRLE